MEWYASLIAVFLGFILGLAPTFGRRLYKCYKKPKLELYLADHKQEIYVDAKLEGEEPHQGRFVHVKVRNNGRQTARCCYAKLICLKRVAQDGKRVRLAEFRDPEALPWANRGERGFDKEDIETDLPLTIDLCGTHEGHPKYVCFYVRGTKIASGRQRHFTPGIYLATVRVYSENAKPCTGTFELEKGNGWTDIRIQELNDE